MSWLSKVFELNRDGLNWARAVWTLDVMLVPLVVFSAIGYPQYLISALFGVLTAEVTDPGGSIGRRTLHTLFIGATGAGLTALGFAIGGEAWGWLVLAAFAVTLAAGLAVMFGAHWFAAAFMLNIWFIITLAIAYSFHHHTHITQYTWAQVVAWSAGAVLWIVLMFIAWLIRGRHDTAPPFPELPGDTTRRKLTAPMITYAVLRALVIAGTVAIAFGALGAAHGYWMAIAAIVAMKPDLHQSTLTAVQRVAGALIGGVAAGLLLLIPANVHGVHLLTTTLALTVVALVLMVHGIGIQFWNYAFYYSAISAGVLLLIDAPQPTNYADEGYRLLWTLCGVAIGLAVMFLAGLLGKRRAAKTPTQPSKRPALDHGSSSSPCPRTEPCLRSDEDAD